MVVVELHLGIDRLFSAVDCSSGSAKSTPM